VPAKQLQKKDIMPVNKNKSQTAYLLRSLAAEICLEITTMKLTLILLTALLLAPFTLLPAAETPPERDDRMTWWREARFGMFIHWGTYAQMAGVWEGKRIDTGVGHGIGEWIMYNGKIPVSDYAREASRFNPTEFNADAWVRLAREAGQRYIIITAKHHDGFALFHSQASPFNIVDHTPFKRDILKELAAACQKHGVRLGFYYSQAQDWHHPGGAAYNEGSGIWSGGDPAAGHWDKAQEGSFDDYLERVAIPQTHELLTNYGPLAVFWWDTPVGMTSERAEKLAALLTLQPGIITNNRLLDNRNTNEFSGDTETPEQTIPPTGFKDRDFEVCMTMNDTWGYKKHDQNWKPASDLIRKLVDVASKGGNFLLNVGPDALGRIPQASVERLQEIGRWTTINGEAIYGTSASPFAKLPWGRCTRKPGTLYLHVVDWPRDGRLIVPGLKTPVYSASLLASDEPLRVESIGNDKLIHVPASAPDPVVSVIRVELDGPLEVDNRLPSPAADGTISLPLWMADIHNSSYGAQALLGEDAGAPAIVNWTDPRTFLVWSFETAEPGSYEIVATLSTSTPGVKLQLHIGKESTTTSIHDGSSTVVLGRLYIPTTGVHELTLRPVAAGWHPLILRSVRVDFRQTDKGLKVHMPRGFDPELGFVVKAIF
jgi:alpha-L-fucosidase